MTDLNDEAVKALVDAEPDVWTWQSCENSQGWNTKFGDAPPKPGPYITDIVPLYGAPAPDLARAFLEARAECDGAHMIIATERAEVVRLRAENARLRADTQAAVAMAVEKAADVAGNAAVEALLRRKRDASPLQIQMTRQNVKLPIRAIAPANGLAMVDALRKERDEWKRLAIAGELTARHVNTVQADLAVTQSSVATLQRMHTDRCRELAAAQAQIEALRGAPFPDETGFYGLIGDAMREADRAMSKFPQPNYVISKVAEEAGEVVKAAIHCAEKRETAENLRGEMKQLIAMLYRLWVEGDGVHGLPSVRAALSAKDS